MLAGVFVHQALFTQDILTHNIAIKRYCDKKTFSRHRFLQNNQGKLFKEHTLIYLLFMHLGSFICQELTLANRNRWLKNIFLSQYLFIAILCVKMSRVNKALSLEISNLCLTLYKCIMASSNELAAIVLRDNLRMIMVKINIL